MDALRSAGKFILRSPGLTRHTRHHKLSECGGHGAHEALQEGVTFHLKYLGMTLVEEPKGEEMAAAAIRRIITMTRASHRKPRKVTVTVTPQELTLRDPDTGEDIERVSIYRISYCTTDKVQDKVFAYVAQSRVNGALECHAFLSPKKKLAQAVTVTVAQAFDVALDLWQAAREDHSVQIPDCNYPSDDQALGVSSGCQRPHGGDAFQELEDGFSSCIMEDGSNAADSWRLTHRSQEPQRQ